MPLGVGQQVALRDQLADHRKPAARVELGADAEGLQPVVAELADALGRVAEQHIDQMVRAKALAGAVDRGERLLRGDGAVPARRPGCGNCRNCRRAVVALAEIAEQGLAAADDGFAKPDQRLGFLALDAALALVDIGRLGQRRRFITSAMP